MMATRPQSSGEGGAAAAAAVAQEEKSVPGVSKDALREERKPLLDLDDVAQLENELAACFDAPPPPPLNIRREEPVATVSTWMPMAEHRYVETHVAPPTASDVAAARARGELPQLLQEGQEQEGGQLQEQQAQATRVSDFSSLYSAAPHREESTGQLYPVLAPSAPFSDTMRIPMPPPAVPTAAPTAARAPSAAFGAAVRDDGAAAAAAAVAAAAEAAEAEASSLTTITATAARERSQDVSSSGEVVEELLSENERLRAIIQEMSDELERGSVPAIGGSTAAAGATQGRQSSAARAAARAATSATPTERLLGRYPGAQAEAARRRREQASQQQQGHRQDGGARPQTQVQPQVQAAVGAGTFVHFKCENCPQWLKVPVHAQLVYCPTCGHTSQMTSASTIHHPPNNGNDTTAAGSSSSTGAAGRGGEEEVGWLGYFKSIIAS
ncbi:expressed unknown protein [Ectocarpus siliculosus]|uniref:Uncharacterized protein n=1 Tax=Ectocarpus siliculosus TaxID=2880 RepID=D7FNV0_ECTSI|nr:expressed unknown protein [Ectocarpus siliculosus]|eukprot:CBJ30226.1 expressed unknown protein [Ectocarpus siliculosus]